VTARLTSAMQVSALLRQVQSIGGHGVLVARGDETAGAILIELRDRGVAKGYFERLLQPSGQYRWDRADPADDDSQKIAAWVDRKRSRDPDIWIVELDIPNAERFIAETIAAD